MNAERLHAIAIAVQKDLESSDILRHIAGLIEHLNRISTAPADQKAQESIASTRETITAELTAAGSNVFPPIWRESLEDLGLSNFLGLQLLGRIDSIFARNQITPVVASQELGRVEADVQNVMKSLRDLTSSLEALHVGKEVLDPGECELGILIPRQFVKNHLGPLGEEFRELDHLLRPLEELASGSREGFAVRTIASSEFGVFLDSAPAVALCIATAIERIVALYKTFLEIRKLRNELAKHVPVSATGEVNDYVDGIVATRIPEIADDLVAEFYIGDDAYRKNELTIEVRHSLRAIAARIDRGFYFEVTCSPPEAEEPEGGDEMRVAVEAQHQVPEVYARIQALSEGMKYIKLDGDPFLLIESDETKSSKEQKKS